MNAQPDMTAHAALKLLVNKGESETFTLKRSSSKVKQPGGTLWALLDHLAYKVLLASGSDGPITDLLAATFAPAVTLTLSRRVASLSMCLAPRMNIGKVEQNARP
jgi:hypothetical protein